jgi:hypothetical protein
VELAKAMADPTKATTELARSRAEPTRATVQMTDSTPELQSAQPTDPAAHRVFTVYALSLNDHQDTETESGTLEEALLHLRELITSELEDSDRPHFDRYGVYVDTERPRKA